MKATINGIVIEMTPAEFLEYNRLAGNEKPAKDYKVSPKQKEIFEDAPTTKKNDFIKRKAFVHRVPHSKKTSRLPEPDRYFGRILRELARRLGSPVFTLGDLEEFTTFDHKELSRIIKHIYKSHAIEVLNKSGSYRFYPSVWKEQILSSKCTLSKRVLYKYLKFN